VPGLSPVSFNERAIAKLKSRKTPVPSWFLDLNLVLSYWNAEGGKRTYHHTAPVNSLYALHESLLLLQEEGLEAAWARHRAQHAKLAEGLAKLGLDFVVPEGSRLPQLNAVKVPAGVDEAALRVRLLNEYNLEIGAGLGPLAGKVWRIGLMGYTCRSENVLFCLAALGAVLNTAP
jgi:alanine-glyoxylate transaminase/serine-glyoxylate transaminase/serine-pyruvate transaminase